MANPPTYPGQSADPHFKMRMDDYWRDYVPPEGLRHFHPVDPFDFPLSYPETDPWSEGMYLAPLEDAPFRPGESPITIQPSGPLNPYHEGYPHGGFYEAPLGDWGQQQYPFNPIDYQAPWNVGPYESWPGYYPAQPGTPEDDFINSGPYVQSPGMFQQAPGFFQGVPYAQQLHGLEGYL